MHATAFFPVFVHAAFPRALDASHWPVCRSDASQLAVPRRSAAASACTSVLIHSLQRFAAAPDADPVASPQRRFLWRTTNGPGNPNTVGWDGGTKNFSGCQIVRLLGSLMVHLARMRPMHVLRSLYGSFSSGSSNMIGGKSISTGLRVIPTQCALQLLITLATIHISPARSTACSSGRCSARRGG